MKLAELVFTAFTMLIGEENVDFCYYRELDPNWWALRLWISRN